jgi:predicted nuclease of restriction endonuclease-like (RecB) superfamily
MDNYHDQIKERLVDVEIQNKVKDYSKNKYTLEKYYEIGKLLIEVQGGEKRAKYGDGLIKEYASKLQRELDKKYTDRYLRNMRQFYLSFGIWKSLTSKLSWSHIMELMHLDITDKINYYVDRTLQNNLSVRKLRSLIKAKEYERLPEHTRNKLITKEEINITDVIPNPIVINNPNNINVVKEKVLLQLILEDIDGFLRQLGLGYTYIGHEYPIKLGDTYNYIDILLFNYIYNCFVVVELKLNELKKEYIGQIETYVNYIDETVKQINHNKTMGIIVSKLNNKYIIKYCTNPNIVLKNI